MTTPVDTLIASIFLLTTRLSLGLEVLPMVAPVKLQAIPHLQVKLGISQGMSFLPHPLGHASSTFGSC